MNFLIERQTQQLSLPSIRIIRNHWLHPFQQTHQIPSTPFNRLHVDSLNAPHTGMFRAIRLLPTLGV